MSSSSESEYETAEEGDDDDDDGVEDGEMSREEIILQEYGFLLHIAEDGTRWFLPMYYRAELELEF